MDKDKVEKYLYEAPLKSATISFMRNTKTTEDKSSFVISVSQSVPNIAYTCTSKEDQW